ncbi:abscisic acid-deficient protein Aba4 family protein, partial [Nocardia gipuzkoensis]
RHATGQLTPTTKPLPPDKSTVQAHLPGPWNPAADPLFGQLPLPEQQNNHPQHRPDRSAQITKIEAKLSRHQLLLWLTYLWVQIIAWDLFVGRWIYLGGRERNIRPVHMAPILLATILLSPVGARISGYTGLCGSRFLVNCDFSAERA